MPGQNRDHAALLKDHTGLLKQLAALKQQHFLQQKELQESQQKSIADAKKNKVDQYVGAANGRYGHSQVASITGSASDQRDYTKQRPPSRDEKSNLSDQSVSLPMSLSTQQSKQEYCEGSVSSTASVSTGDRVQKNSSAAQVALPRNISGESDTFRSRVVESEIKIPDARTRTLSTAIIEKKIVIDVLTQQINHSALIVLPPPVVAVAVPLAAIRPAEVKHGSSSSSSSSSQVNSLRSSALLPIYQDFLMSISLLPHALHGRTRNINSRVSSRSSTVEIDTSWSGATPLRSVQRNFNVLVREQQNYSTTVAADRMQGRLSVELVSSLCVFAHFLLSESSGKVVLGRDGKYFLTASAGIYIPLKRSQDGENRGREEIKGLSNSLLRCLSLLEGVLDYMTPQTVAAVRRARLSSTEPPSTDISNSNVCGRNSIAVDGVGERIKTQVDLNETFNKVASVGVADTNRKMPRERIESADLGAGTSTSESARLGLKFPPLGKSLEFVSLKEADSYPVNTTIPKDPRGSTLYRGLSVSGRGHGSGMKSNVTFAENSQSTPILGGSDRSVSGDESAPPSTSTAYDCGVTVQKRARIRGPVGSDSPATCCSVMPSFSLSSLIMPAVSQTNLRAVYNSITSFSSLTNGVLDAAQPSRDSTESSPDDELSVANRCWADLPGEIVKLLDGVITLIKSLGTLDPSSECDFSDSSDGLIPDLIRRLTERTVGILNKAYQGL